MTNLTSSKVLLAEATGGIWIGDPPLLLQASFPFGKIELTSDEVVLRIQYFPKFILNLITLVGEVRLPYEKIIKTKNINLWVLGYGIRFYHNEKEYPKMLIIWLWPLMNSKVKNIKSILSAKIGGSSL